MYISTIVKTGENEIDNVEIGLLFKYLSFTQLICI